MTAVLCGCLRRARSVTATTGADRALAGADGATPPSRATRPRGSTLGSTRRVAGTTSTEQESGNIFMKNTAELIQKYPAAKALYDMFLPMFGPKS